MSHELFFVEEYRDLSDEETNLIHWLIFESDHLELREQIKKAKVVSKCGCGCKTVDLKVESFTAQPIGFVLSASGLSVEGIPLCVVLHIREGLISELEIFSDDGREGFSPPDVNNLHLEEVSK